MVLYGKQMSFLKDVKKNYILLFKATIPRIYMLLGRCLVCSTKKHLRCLVTAGVSPYRDRRYLRICGRLIRILPVTSILLLYDCCNRLNFICHDLKELDGARNRSKKG